MKMKKLLLSWLKILFLLLSIYPESSSKKEIYNDTGYIIEIDAIKLHIYFTNHSTLEDGLELSDVSKNGGPLIISGHSGTGRLALFNDLEFLNENNIVRIYHNNSIQEYLINKITYYKKFSKVVIPDDKNYLYLITCDKYDMQKQLIISAKLANIIYF